MTGEFKYLDWQFRPITREQAAKLAGGEFWVRLAERRANDLGFYWITNSVRVSVTVAA